MFAFAGRAAHLPGALCLARLRQSLHLACAVCGPHAVPVAHFPGPPFLTAVGLLYLVDQCNETDFKRDGGQWKQNGKTKKTTGDRLLAIQHA